jgi:hypothetical protein
MYHSIIEASAEDIGEGLTFTTFESSPPKCEVGGVEPAGISVVFEAAFDSESKKAINQSITQWNSQPSDRPINRSINQSINGTASRVIDQSINQSITRTAD